MGGTWSVDPIRHQIAFVSFSAIVRNTSAAVNWSHKLNTGVEPVWSPRIDPYTRLNYLTWKEVEETKKMPVSPRGLPSGSTLNYGDGVIAIQTSTMDSETTLFEMPFAASTNSEETIPGYGPPVLIKTRSVSGRGDTLSITSQNTTVRLLLAATGQTFPVQSTRLKPDNETLEAVTVNLTPCWFGVRPDFIVSADTRYCLSFSPLPLGRGEQCLIDRYYDGLIRVLRRMRMVEVSMYLTASDIAGLDFERPVLLDRVQVGSLVVSAQYAYLNKISDYVTGHPCQVTLICF